MKIHEPEKLEGYKCEWCFEGGADPTHYFADQLRWSSEGWLCDGCFEQQVLSWDKKGEAILKASESPDWDGKTLKEYLKSPFRKPYWDMTLDELVEHRKDNKDALLFGLRARIAQVLGVSHQDVIDLIIKKGKR